MKRKFVGVLVSLIFIVILLVTMRDKADSILMTLKNGNRFLIFISLLVFLSTVLIMGIRLQLIFATKNIKMKLTETINLTFIGYFFNNVLPTSVGGDLVKAMCASRVTKEPVKTFTIVMMDRIFGLFMFVLIPSASLLFLKDKIDPHVPLIVYSFLGVSMAFFFLLFNRTIARKFRFVETILNRFGIGAKIRSIYDELHDFKNHKGVVVIAMLISIFGQAVGIFVLYLLAVALGADPATWVYFFLLVPVVQLISMAPFSLGGLGVREGLYVFFLKNYIGTACAFGMGLLSLGLLLLCSLIGGIIYLTHQDYHIQFNKKIPETS